MKEKQFCDKCGSDDIVVTTNKVIYGRDYGDDPTIYYCNNCHAWVSAKNGPKARMAGPYTRELRKLCHARFDYIWKTKLIGREELYKRLANRLGLTKEQCHFSVMSDKFLRKTIKILYGSSKYHSIMAKLDGAYKHK